MTDRFANLAGYHGEETTAFRSSIATSNGGGLSELDESDDSVVNVQPLQQKALNARNGSSRSSTPVTKATSAASKEESSPSNKTPTRLEHKEIATPTTASRGGIGSSRKQRATPRSAVRRAGNDEDHDVSDSFEDSEVEMHRTHRNTSLGNDTTGIDTMAIDDSGFAGARHVIGRRSAAGISLKDSEARIKKLEAENNELRIECDLWRQQMRPDEARLKVVTISKELARNRKTNIDLMRLLKEQDSSIKESKRILKRWGHLDPKEEQRMRKELEEQLRQAQATIEEEKAARARAEEEIDAVRRNEGDQDSRLRQLLEEEREDHAEAIYTMEREKEALEAQLDQVQDGAAAKQEIRQLEDEIADLEQHLKSKEVENDQLLERLEESQKTRVNHESDIEKLRSRLAETQSAEDSFSRELEVANRRLEHLTTDQQEEMARIRDAEDAVAERLGVQIDQLRDEVAEAKLEVQSKMEYIETLEAQREDDDVKFEEMELEIERATRALEEKEDEINKLNEDLDELDLLCSRLKQDAQEADDEVRKLKEVVKLKEEDLTETNRELKQMTNDIVSTEEENEILKREANAVDEEMRDLVAQLEETRERSERKEKAYKDRLQQAETIKIEIQSQLEAIEKEYANAAEDSHVLGRDVDLLKQDRRDLKKELEKVYEKLDEAVADLKEEERKREQLEDELEARIEEKETRLKRILEEREEAMQSLEAQLVSVEQNLADSKGDVEALQNALRNKENESARLGQSHSHDLHSMELEIDRLKRDLSRCESDLNRTRSDLEKRDEAVREKESRLDIIYTENRNLSSKLAAETQNAKGLLERLQSHQRSNEDATRELQQARNKAATLETEVNRGERTLMQAEQAIKNQLTERNTLLLTIYQYMGKILGNDKVKTGKRGEEAELKPFTNFAIFNDSLIARLRKISDIQQQFEQKAKVIEDNFAEKLNGFKRQQDGRFRQIDRFEVAIKNAIDKQGQWRSRVVSKQSELESIKTTNAELQAQLTSLKTRSLLSSPGEAGKVSTLATRANNAERRLAAAQSQASQAEERLTEAKTKYGEGEGKWAARIKELESRNRAAEEKVKRERQGAKERVNELVEQVRRLEKELEGAAKRNKVLDEVKAAAVV